MSQFIGIGDELGKGAYKKAYKAIESLFTTTGLDINKLAVVSITFYEAKSIKIENIIEEIKLQNDYANNEPQLAPKIYLVTIQYGNEFLKNIPIDDFLENGIETYNSLINANKLIKIFFLEELCGPTPSHKQQPLIIDDNFFNKVDELIDNLIAKSNLLFTDFKPQNTCPQYDASGNLINIMALDLDLKFSYSIDEIKDDINNILQKKDYYQSEVDENIVIDFIKDYMFIQFYYMLLKYATNLTPENKDFIKRKIKVRLPQEKLLKQLSIFIPIILMYCSKLLQTPNTNFRVMLNDIQSKFPIFSYVPILSLYKENNKQIKDIDKYTSDYISIYNKNWFLAENEPYLKTHIMNLLFNEISSVFYNNYNTNNNLIFTDIVYIVNPEYTVSLEDLNNMPIVADEEPYNPINTKEIQNKKEYAAKDAEYNIDDDLFGSSEGGKRKTRKNKRNKRNRRLTK